MGSLWAARPGWASAAFALINHATLRLLLWRERSIPLRYARFLDACVDLIFLRRVGGGYIFVHPLLQAYFAALDADREVTVTADSHGQRT